VRGVGVSAAIATLFGVWQICADLLVTRFPKDINVPSPQSWLFYPAIGYVVEVFFHALPLALLQSRGATCDFDGCSKEAAMANTSDR
jgi:hypothetical protein